MQLYVCEVFLTCGLVRCVFRVLLLSDARCSVTVLGVARRRENGMLLLSIGNVLMCCIENLILRSTLNSFICICVLLIKDEWYFSKLFKTFPFLAFRIISLPFSSKDSNE
jgi:hypothetical protein